MKHKLAPLPPHKRVSLGEQVYETLREGIVTLRLAPGQMIYENELSSELGVSRTPIREAIRLLVSEELLEVLPQRGTRVSQISVRKVEEARFIREQLEVGAFLLAARSWKDICSPAAKQELWELLQTQTEAADAEDSRLFLALDESFHRMILESTGNRTLLQTVASMRGHLNRVRYLALDRYHEMKPLVVEHEAILKALDAGDIPSLPGLLEAHFNKLDTQLPRLKEAYPDYFKA
jgi:GntR family transcriptional regulator, rspAB operon transcriptional repressor